MAKTKNLQSLGDFIVGEKVLVKNRSDKYILPIERITDGRGGTIYVGGLSFDAQGRQRGDVWQTAYISIPTKQDYVNVKGRNAIIRLRKVEWSSLTPEKAIEIEKLLNDNDIKTRK